MAQDATLNHSDHPPLSPAPKVGAILKSFASSWNNISKDPWILLKVADGLQLEFISFPTQFARPSEGLMSESAREVGNKEVADLLEKGAITQIDSETVPQGFFSRLLAVPKKSGGHRPIINIKELNEFIVDEKFKMESLSCVQGLVRSGDWSQS